MTKDRRQQQHFGAELQAAINKAVAAERAACAAACEAHAAEPQIMLATRITDNPRAVVARECAELIRDADQYSHIGTPWEFALDARTVATPPKCLM